MAQQDPARHPGYRTGQRGSEPLLTADVAVVGAGAAGLYAALTADRAGAPRRARLRDAARADRELLGAGRDRRRARRSRTPPSSTSATPRPPAATPSAARPRRCSSTEAPGCVADLERLGVRFDADRRGILALGLEGGHSRRRVVHAGGSATGRRIVRQLSALAVDRERDRGARGRARSAWSDDGRCVGILLEDGRAIRARATILATGGAAALWSRTTNPPGSLGIGLSLAHAAGRRPRRPRVPAVPPDRGQGHPGPRGLPRHRGHPRRGRDAARPRRRALRRRAAPRDEVARAIDAAAARAGRARRRDLDMRDVDPARFPNVVAALTEAGLDPTTERDPGLARVALHDGRDRHRPARPQHRARPVRDRRDGLHRAARRQPPRLELA